MNECMDCGGPNNDPLSRRCGKCKKIAADQFWVIFDAEEARKMKLPGQRPA